MIPHKYQLPLANRKKYILDKIKEFLVIKSSSKSSFGRFCSSKTTGILPIIIFKQFMKNSKKHRDLPQKNNRFFFWGGGGRKILSTILVCLVLRAPNFFFLLCIDIVSPRWSVNHRTKMRSRQDEKKQNFSRNILFINRSG